MTRRIARAAPWLAGLWVGTYVPMAVLHLVRDTTAPWTQTPASALEAMTSPQVATLIIALGAVAGAALALVKGSRSGPGRPAAWLLVAVGLVWLYERSQLP